MGQDTILGHEGRYDADAQRILREQEAKAVLVVVIEGKKGFGMSMACLPEARDLGFGAKFAALLRRVAESIDGGATPDGLRLTKR